MGLVPFCGPTAATRLAATTRWFRAVLSPDFVRAASAECSLQTLEISGHAFVLLNPIRFLTAFASSEEEEDVWPDAHFLDAVCCACSRDLDPTDRAKGFDDVIVLLAQRVDPTNAALWAAAVGRHSLAELLRRFDPPE